MYVTIILKEKGYQFEREGETWMELVGAQGKGKMMKLHFNYMYF